MERVRQFESLRGPSILSGWGKSDKFCYSIYVSIANLPNSWSSHQCSWGHQWMGDSCWHLPWWFAFITEGGTVTFLLIRKNIETTFLEFLCAYVCRVDLPFFLPFRFSWLCVYFTLAYNVINQSLNPPGQVFLP